MSAIPITNDRDAAPGRSSPTGPTGEPIQPEDTPNGRSTDVTEATIEAAAGEAAGEEDLVQGGEAPGIDSPPGDLPDLGDTSRSPGCAGPRVVRQPG